MSSEKVIFYLAYGSNLAAETFLGRRGIRPLSSVNVAVPSLRLRFDLPGIPYAEPCFANSGPRQGSDRDTPEDSEDADDMTLMLDHDQLESQEYHKDRWHKPMVGVVYGLTPQDYAHVIATEGGGTSYKDVEIPCYPLDPEDKTVPAEPRTTPFKAHTLYAPPRSGKENKDGRVHRPDPSYAQPSARYLKLIRDGAREHKMPQDYLDYLDQIRPYQITTTQQQMGKVIFLGLWMPLILTLFKIMASLTDENGRAPEWAQRISAFIFTLCWASYDLFFKRAFGDGERTIGQGENSMRTTYSATALRPCAIFNECQKAVAAKAL